MYHKLQRQRDTTTQGVLPCSLLVTLSPPLRPGNELQPHKVGETAGHLSFDFLVILLEEVGDSLERFLRAQHDDQY